VFRAYEPVRDRLVAIKVFRLDLTPEQTSLLVRHFDELIAAAIDHPNIAAPIAAGIEGETAYLAQEFAVGESLDVVLRERGRMSIRDVVTLVDSLAAAVDHAASCGVRHGALHMRDIILSPDGARVTGFGVAAALSKISAKVPTRPQYSHPDAPSDVYSLGAIAFEAVTGKRVSPDNLDEFEAAHGAELRGAFGIALAADAALRPERAGDFADVLRDAAHMAAEAQAFASVAPAFAPEEPLPPAGNPVDDLDLRIDRTTDLMEAPAAPSASQSSWSAQPPRTPQGGDDLPASHSPWPVVVTFVVFAVLAALAVGFFLRSPAPGTGGGAEYGVEETEVDVPSGAPPPSPTPQPDPPKPRPPARPPAAPASPAASDPSARAQKSLRGSLLIRSTPGDADVFVNGRERGKTPIAVRDLELGSYTIRVVREGYATEEQKLELTARRPAAATMFNLRASGTRADGSAGLTGRIRVESRPSGAQVFVNDRLVGSTPFSMPEVLAGPVTVRIEFDGYQPWTTTVRVNDGEQARVAASLERK
jgi:serine/threonine protein kinase